MKIQSLQAQLERLELRSPVAGVVLQGEWYRSEGAPVARGDTMFEIAPLEVMTVQVHLTTEDLGEIYVGDGATIRIDSAYGEAWQGTLSRIDPRASVVDNKVCFIADMEVANRENRLRPGMKGTVRIETGYKSIGWLVFHRPYTWLMKNLVW